jgi:hypothetical protein
VETIGSGPTDLKEVAHRLSVTKLLFCWAAVHPAGRRRQYRCGKRCLAKDHGNASFLSAHQFKLDCIR